MVFLALACQLAKGKKQIAGRVCPVVVASGAKRTCSEDPEDREWKFQS